MNEQDEFWFWVMRAISEPNESKNIYFYDKKEDSLFALKKFNNEFLPIFRNSTTQNFKQVNEAFIREISKVQKSNSEIMILPKLSLKEKTDYLFKFVSKIENAMVKSQLQSEMVTFTENDDFKLKLDLKSIDSSLNLKYDIDKGVFLANKIKEMYFPLGISEKSKIIW